MKTFNEYARRQGVPARLMPQARKALDIAKGRSISRANRETVAYTLEDGTPVTYGQMIALFDIDRYVEVSGDGPESLKDLFRF